MKKDYVMPSIYVEAFVADQYVAASGCTNKVKIVTPDHGHVQVKSEEIHCAFTSNNCGKSSTCYCTGCEETVGLHNILTEGTSFTKVNKPVSKQHNCHILDNKDDARYFAENYMDDKCGDGVAKLYGLKNFDEMVEAFS